MRTLGKFFLVLVWSVLLLSLGYYLVLNNLNSILATGQAGVHCRFTGEGLLLQSGPWVEALSLKPRFKFRNQIGNWVISGDYGTITIMTKPKLQVIWKKPVFRRKSFLQW